MPEQPNDPYRAAAAKMFDVPYDQVTPEQRRKAKQAAYFAAYTQPPKEKK